jgi:predicted lipoprotein
MSLHSQADINPIDWSTTNQQVVDHLLIQPYKKLALSTQSLQSHVEGLCRSQKSSTSKNKWLKTQKQFRTTYLDWAKVQHITIGPMAYLKRIERFQYWPDKHFVKGKQIRRLLNNPLPTLSLQQLQQKSVAVQGLPALERLLFPKGDTFPYTQCPLSILISQNLHAIAQENYTDWTKPPVNFRDELLNPNESVGIYASKGAIAGQLFHLLSTQLLSIEILKLQRVLGKNNVHHKPRNLEAWRSGLSLPIIHTNLRSLQSLYLHGFDTHLKKVDAVLANNIMISFDRLITLALNHDLPLYESLSQESNPEIIIEINQKLSALHRLIAVNMSQKMGFSEKFNALDGD